MFAICIFTANGLTLHETWNAGLPVITAIKTRSKALSYPDIFENGDFFSVFEKKIEKYVSYFVTTSCQIFYDLTV